MRAKLGQNFLADDLVLEFEAETANVRGKSVLEIGAGDGRLTRKLLSHGAGHITAVEMDGKLAKLLRTTFHYRVFVVEDDILLFDESRRFNCIVGNIPYYITSPILLKLSRMDFGKAVLCLQKEVVERMMAPSGSPNYGRLSVFCQLAFSMEHLAEVPREAFLPKPKVDSAIISLAKTGLAVSPSEEKVIGAIFSHRKKSLRNAVVDARRELFGSEDKKGAMQLSQSLKYAPRKVFLLSPQEALKTARELLEKKGI